MPDTPGQCVSSSGLADLAETLHQILADSFASVFGTPLGGAVFGLEVLLIGSLRYDAILPSFLAATCADLVTRAWGVGYRGTRCRRRRPPSPGWHLSR